MDSQKLLPGNHRRSLSVTSKMIEQSLDDIELTLKGKFNNKITHIIEPSYDTGTKEKIFEIINEIKTVNKEMFTSLSLTAQKNFESRVVQSQAVYLWSILSDSTSKKLMRYGDLTQEECKLVDNYILKLLTLLDKLKEF